MILRWLRLNTLLSRSEPNRFFRVGRASDAQGGTGPMAVKPAEGAVSQVCRVCGVEVSRNGECLLSGTKQSDQPTVDEKDTATWLKGDSDGGLNAWIGASVAGGDSKDDALGKWLAGEDSAFQDWIGVPTISGGAKTARTPAERVSDDKVRELRTKALEVDGLHAELEAMRATLNRELANFRQGKFDPVKYIEETATLSKQLQTEIAKRRELEQEIEHIKKGSIAVIKYVKTQQLKAGASPELKKRLDQETKARQALEADVGEQRSVNEQLRKQLESGLGKMKPDQREVKKRELDLVEREATFKAKEERLASMPAGEGGAPSEELKRRFEEELREMAEDYLAKEEEFKKRIIGLEQEVGKYKIEDKVRAEAKAFEGKPKSEVQAAFSRKEQEVLHKEKMVLMREQELQRLQADLQVKEDEIKKVKEPLTYKEEELLRREEDLMYREKVLQAEHRKMEEAKAQGGSVEELDLKSRLEELKSTITAKEEEVRTKERYLQQKMEELRLREQGLISEDIEARDKDLQVEVKQQKVHRRADGLSVNPEGGRGAGRGVEEEVPDVPACLPQRVDAHRVSGPNDDIQVPPALCRAAEAGQGRGLLRDRERDARGAGDPDARVADGRKHRVQGRAAEVVPVHQGHLRRAEPGLDPVHVHEIELVDRVVLAGPHQVITRFLGNALCLVWRAAARRSPGGSGREAGAGGPGRG